MLILLAAFNLLKASPPSKLITASHSVILSRHLSPSLALRNMELTKITSILHELVPLHLAESWDNTGLLIEPSRPHKVNKILLTNDLTAPVLRESVQLNSNLIISYHPAIFKPFKRLTQDTPLERVLLDCIKSNIAVYSTHTSVDVINGGNNDWLLEAFSGLGGDHTVVPAHPHATDDKIGIGRIIHFSQKIPLQTVLDSIKKHLGLEKIRLASPPDTTIANSTIASIGVCAGSGSEVLRGVMCDLLWSGEMPHHAILAATARGKHVVLCDHTNTERGYLPSFRRLLSARLSEDVEILISKEDKEPLVVI